MGSITKQLVWQSLKFLKLDRTIKSAWATFIDSTKSAHQIMIVNKYGPTMRHMFIPLNEKVMQSSFSLRHKQALVAPFLYLTSARKSYQHGIFAASIDLQLIYQISREFGGGGRSEQETYLCQVMAQWECTISIWSISRWRSILLPSCFLLSVILFLFRCKE